jgi:hypothetical protein
MDKVAATTSNGIESVADLAERVGSPLDISVKIADKVAAGAKKIEGRVAGAVDEKAPAAEGEAKPARRARAVAVRKTA